MQDVRFENGAVACANQIVANVGADILQRGGNAVDAAVAAALAECVVAPGSVGIGGYGGAAVVYTRKDGKAVALDFDGCAPLASTPDMFVGNEPAAERGYAAVMAPPIIRGLAALLERYGTISFADAAEHAHKLADEGFPTYSALANGWGLFLERADEDSIRAILPDGVPPKEGEPFVQKDLAALIARLREEGPEAFYSGEIPSAIVSAVRKHGGILDEADFAVPKARFEEPLSVSSGEYEVLTPQPPAGGLSTLEILNSMNALPACDAGSPEFYRLFIEAARHAWVDRLTLLGDPEFVNVPVADLLSDRRAREIATCVKAGEKADFGMAVAPGDGHTIHLVAADKQGNVVSLTETHGLWLGSWVAIPGLGLVLGNGMSRFDLEPGRANSIAPRKRVLHNMCPVLITRKGQPYCAVGLPGGRKIVNVAALLSYLITREDMTVGAAIDLPRAHVEGPEEALVTSEELVSQMKARFGQDYPVAYAKKLGDTIAGVIIDPETGHQIAASSNGPECVAGV